MYVVNEVTLTDTDGLSDDDSDACNAQFDLGKWQHLFLGDLEASWVSAFFAQLWVHVAGVLDVCTQNH